MNRTAISIGILGLAAAVSSAETLKLRAGAAIQAPVSSMDSRAITLEDGRVLPRESVEEIQFVNKEAPAAAVAADPEAQSRGRELFRQAEDFGKRFPGVDGLVLLDEGEYILNEDGTWVERTHFVGRILKEGLKRSWG
jgi:hypothetical protein